MEPITITVSMTTLQYFYHLIGILLVLYYVIFMGKWEWTAKHLLVVALMMGIGWYVWPCVLGVYILSFARFNETEQWWNHVFFTKKPEEENEETTGN